MIQIASLDAKQHAHEVQTLKTAYAAGMKHTEVIDDFANRRLRADLPHGTRPVEVPNCLHRPTDRQVFPYYRVYQTHDGYITIAALHRLQRRKLCAALGLEDPDVDTNPSDVTDEQYYKQKSLMRRIEERLRTNSNQHWLAKLEAAGVPCAPVTPVPTCTPIHRLQRSISSGNLRIGTLARIRPPAIQSDLRRHRFFRGTALLRSVSTPTRY